MKFTLVRFKEDKRPVCVLGGHLNELNVFHLIDEWHDPNVCEFTYVEISKYCFSWCWNDGAKNLKEIEDCTEDGENELGDAYCYSEKVQFGELLLMELSKYFESEDGFDIEWLSVTYNPNFG